MRNTKRSQSLSLAARKVRNDRAKFEAKKREALKAMKALESAITRAKTSLMTKAKETGLIVSKLGLTFIVEGALTSNPTLESDIEQAMNEMAENVITAIRDEVKEASQ